MPYKFRPLWWCLESLSLLNLRARVYFAIFPIPCRSHFGPGKASVLRFRVRDGTSNHRVVMTVPLWNPNEGKTVPLLMAVLKLNIPRELRVNYQANLFRKNCLLEGRELYGKMFLARYQCRQFWSASIWFERISRVLSNLSLHFSYYLLNA